MLWGQRMKTIVRKGRKTRVNFHLLLQKEEKAWAFLSLSPALPFHHSSFTPVIWVFRTGAVTSFVGGVSLNTGLHHWSISRQILPIFFLEFSPKEMTSENLEGVSSWTKYCRDTFSSTNPAKVIQLHVLSKRIGMRMIVRKTTVTEGNQQELNRNGFLSKFTHLSKIMSVSQGQWFHLSESLVGHERFTFLSIFFLVIQNLSRKGRRCIHFFRRGWVRMTLTILPLIWVWREKLTGKKWEAA